MTTLRAAAQQALEFIKVTNARSQFWLVPESNLNKTVKALKAALEQPDRCSNCASLEAQNTYLDRKLAELERRDA